MKSIQTGIAHTEYTQIGHSTGLVVRLQTLATPSTTMISGTTRRLVEGFFQLKSSTLWLHAHDNAPVTEGWFHLDIREAYLAKHLSDLTARILLSWHGLQHRDVHCSYWEWAGAIIVEQHLVNDNPAARRQTIETLSSELLALFGRPIMKDHSVEMQIGGGELIDEEIARLRGDSAT